MGVVYLILGIIMGILCMALAVSLDIVFTAIPTGTIELFQVALFFLGLACFFIGAIEK